MLRRRFLAGTVGAVGMLAGTGCLGVPVRRDQDDVDLPTAATKIDGTEVWDLRRRPTAEQVGIGAGDDTAIYETRPERPVLLRLPEGMQLRLSVRYIAFSAILSDDGRPGSVDVKTAMMPLGDTVESHRSVLKQLGLPISAVSEFHDAARGASGTERVHADRMTERFGDLELGVVARYSPHSETGVIGLGGGWGR